MPSAPIRHSLATRIIAGVAFILALWAVTAVVTLRRMADVEHQLMSIVDVYTGLSVDVHELHRLHVAQEMAFEKFMAHERDDKSRNEFHDLATLMVEILDRAGHRLETGLAMSEPGPEADTLRALGERFAQLREGCALCVREGMAAMESGVPVGASNDLPEFSRRVAAFVGELRAYLDRVDRVGRASLEQGVRSHETAVTWIRTILFVSLAVGAGILLLVIRWLAPLRELVGAIQRVGRGDYAHRVPVRSSDEIGALAAEVNRMAEAVAERASALEAHAAAIERARTLERRLEESERMASLGRMATNIAHEVRNPLSSIKMSLQILGRRLDLSENDRRRIEIARREMGHLDGLLREVLEYSGSTALSLEPTGLSGLVAETLALVRDALDQRGVRVRVLEPEEPVEAVLDREQAGRLLVNLVLNAMDAMEDAAERLLQVSFSSANGNVILEVSDSGCGIADDVRREMFSPFYTTRPEGTGLGLAIVWGIVQAHGGTIDVETAADSGTTMRVTLPREGPGER